MVNPSGALHTPVILFDSVFPRQRSKSPGEQRFAAVVSDSDYLLQPEPLVLTARVKEMDWDHHSVLQHPIALPGSKVDKNRKNRRIDKIRNTSNA
jgi:hypothetical protein